MIEVVFYIVRETSNIEGFESFQKKSIFTAYADDTTFFLKNTESVINLLEIFKHLSQFSCLKPSKSKSEIAGISVLKGVKMALCGMRCVNLHEDSIKILDIHYSYNKQLENGENFKKHIAKTDNVLKLWRARNLSLVGKITVSRIRIFRYKILHNVLYLNKRLLEFEKINSPECFLCKCEEDTTIHLFHICRKTQALWTQLSRHLNRHLNLPHFTPQSAIFGFLDIKNKDCLVVSYLLLLFKY